MSSSENLCFGRLAQVERWSWEKTMKSCWSSCSQSSRKSKTCSFVIRNGRFWGRWSTGRWWTWEMIGTISTIHHRPSCQQSQPYSLVHGTLCREAWQRYSTISSWLTRRRMDRADTALHASSLSPTSSPWWSEWPCSWRLPLGQNWPRQARQSDLERVG